MTTNQIKGLESQRRMVDAIGITPWFTRLTERNPPAGYAGREENAREN